MDRGVIATASELFQARHYPGVVALITDALEGEPDCVPLLLVRARAHMALRRDREAQADLRDIIRLDPQCSLAYRLLGELAARRNENDSAGIFFAEALRLDPSDHEADTWLAIVQCTARPAAGRRPSPRLASGTSAPRDERPTARFLGQRPVLRATSVRPDARMEVDERTERRVEPARREVSVANRLPRASSPPSPPYASEPTTLPRSSSPPVRREPSAPHPMPAAVERPVARYGPDILTDLDIEALPPPPDVRFAAGSSSHLEPYRPQTGQIPLVAHPRHAGVFLAYPAESHTHDSEEVTGRDSHHETATRRAPSAPVRARGSEPHVDQPTKQGAQPVRRPLSQPSPSSRGPMPELPGFGEYLVSTGILTQERLRAAQAYQRSMKVQLATAIVTLGLATPQRIEWAAVAHQSQLARGR